MQNYGKILQYFCRSLYILACLLLANYARRNVDITKHSTKALSELAPLQACISAKPEKIPAPGTNN